jgi:hypothetical protein
MAHRLAEVGRFSLAVLFAGLAVFALTAQGATIHPNLTDDQTQISAAGCGRDVPDFDHCALREAIQAAQPGDVVSLESPAPAGTYGLVDNERLVDKNITIRGAGARLTTVSGAGCAARCGPLARADGRE